MGGGGDGRKDSEKELLRDLVTPKEAKRRAGAAGRSHARERGAGRWSRDPGRPGGRDRARGVNKLSGLGVVGAPPAFPSRVLSDRGSPLCLTADLPSCFPRSQWDPRGRRACGESRYLLLLRLLAFQTGHDFWRKPP